MAYQSSLSHFAERQGNRFGRAIPARFYCHGLDAIKITTVSGTEKKVQAK